MKTVFFDIDTQIDFLYPAGALYVPGAEAMIPAIAKLNLYASAQEWPLISTMDAHPENDPEFRDWPAHCVVGTMGQTKPAITLLGSRIVVPNKRSDIALPRAAQVIIEKRALNCFTNPNLAGVLALYDPQRYVVYGVVAEICVAMAAMGLLETGARVELVTDAVMPLDPDAYDKMLETFQATGGVLTTIAQVCRVN